MKVRIIKRNDDGISVIRPAPKSRRKDETEEQWLNRVFAKATPERVTFEDVDETEIPSDRTFRNAWIKGVNGKAIEICPIKKAAIFTKNTELEAENLIQAKMRKMAIAELQKEGKL